MENEDIIKNSEQVDHSELHIQLHYEIPTSLLVENIILLATKIEQKQLEYQ